MSEEDTTTSEEKTSKGHSHDFHELGRYFPLSEADYDLEFLVPHGIHDPETGRLVTAAMAKQEGGAILDLLKEKAPTPMPCVYLQCQDPDCPQGPKFTKQVNLTDAEHEKIKAALENGDLDPDHDGTNRYLSSLSLTQLGLKRIDDLLGPGRYSGIRTKVPGL